MLTCPMCKKKLRGVERNVRVAGPTCPCCTTTSRNYAMVWCRRKPTPGPGNWARRSGPTWPSSRSIPTTPRPAVRWAPVVTAVRQFDRAPGRRFAKRLQKQTRFRRLMANLDDEGDLSGWFSGLFWFILVVCALVFGFILGQMADKPPPAPAKLLQPLRPRRCRTRSSVRRKKQGRSAKILS